MRRYSFRKKTWRFLVALLDGWGDRFWAPSLKRDELPETIKKILLIRLDHLGDGILLTPLVRELKRSFPDAEITAIFSPEIAQIFKDSPYLDKIHILKNHWLSRGLSWFSWGEVLKLARELRREAFDLGLDPRGDLRNILFLTWIGARYRIGYGSSGGGFLLQRELSEDLGDHEVDRNLKLLGALGKIPQESQTELKSGTKPGDFSANRYLVIHGGAGTSAKRWPPTYWKSLVSFFVRQNKTVVLVGKGKPETELAEAFQGESKVLNGIGRWSLDQTWAVIRDAELFIGSDSGLAHGAGALGVKTLVLESGTNESERWGVQGPQVRRLRFPVFCSPCHLENCRFKTHDCMNRISEAMVEEAAQLLLNH